MIIRPQRKGPAFQQWPRLYGLLAVILLISFPTMTIISPSFLVSTDSNLDENELSAATPSTALLTSSARATSFVSFSSPVRIVMLLGIEGTGHHFWQDLLKESPLFNRLKDLGIYPTFTKPILKSLYRHKKGRWKALWSATCKWNETDPSPNMTEIQDTLVDALHNVTRQVEATRSSSSSSSAAASPIIIPINLLGSGNENGFVSYPGFLKPCRALSYPNMDVWYQVCQRARVDCEHVYIYRNPYSVVRSTTTNRPLNVGIMDAIHLYTTQLHVLHTQLVTFPHQLVGCLNYDTMMSPIQFRDEINPLFGFPNDEAFLSTLKKVFVPKKPPQTLESQRDIVSAEFDLYMQSMVRAHEMVIKTCTDLTKQNRMAKLPLG